MTYTFKLSRRLAVIFLCAVAAVVLVALGFLLGSSPDSTRYIPLLSDRLAPLLRSRAATWTFHLIVVAIGCAAGRVFPFQREFAGAREFLEHMFPSRSLQFYERADFFLSCALGSVLGMLIVQPTSVHAALATGLGWPFIVRFLVEGMSATGRPPENGKAAGR
jgi:branched-subunit amino acid transport protein AzlD